MRTVRSIAWVAGGMAAAAGGYVGLVTGTLTVDLGVGRRIRALGPIEVDIRAPRPVVFDVATAPYAARPSRAMREKVEVLERGDGMVLAAHHTPIRRGLVATTVETVSFDPPGRIGFRLVRGPVPHVAETFALTETPDGTRLRYDGELGTDLWDLGERWGAVVADAWERAVRASLDQIRTEAERRSG